MIPLPIQPPRRTYRSNLLSLTADLPVNPHIDPLAAPPWALDFVNPGFFPNHRVRHGDERKLWVTTIRALVDEQDHLTIFARGSKSNWNRDDEHLPTICTAVAFSGGNETTHAVRNLGITATAHDADLGSLVTAARLAQGRLNQHPTSKITTPSPNPAAIQAITNLRPHAGQLHSREFCNTLTQIFSLFRRTKLHLEWCPPKPATTGLKRCAELAQANAANPLPPHHREPHTLTYQTQSAKDLAISAWQTRWHRDPRQSQVYLALPAPPNGKMAPAVKGASGGSRHASATFVRLITGHAFIGAYAARFHPRKPTNCPECGANPQTVAHVIQQCPRYARARAAHLTPTATDLSLSTLFGTKKGGKALLAFLEETKACFKPREEVHDPG